jgi:carbon-monoxide dehydrogenase medium subunit
VLVDLNNIPDLAFIRVAPEGGLRLGAMTRHVQVERDPLVAERAPLIFETCPRSLPRRSVPGTRAAPPMPILG